MGGIEERDSRNREESMERDYIKTTEYQDGRNEGGTGGQIDAQIDQIDTYIRRYIGRYIGR